MARVRSELDIAIDNKLKDHTKIETRIEKINRLLRHMAEISGDPSGSNPADYLSEQDAKTVAEFVEIANELGWPASDTIVLRKTRNISPANAFDRPAWVNPRNTAKSGLTKALFFPRAEDERRGYVFGELGLSPSQQVAICDDGLLRSLRGPELERSKGVGWGRLPDPGLLIDALANGSQAGIDYGINNIGIKLIARIPGDDLAQLDK